METSIEVRYAGVVVGRTSHARELDVEGRGQGMFVGIAEPLPVGTLVTLKIGDAVREARVDEVVEAADPNAVGMRVLFDVTARASAPRPASVTAAPAPMSMAASPEAAPPVPVVDAPSAAVVAEADTDGSNSTPLSLAASGGDPGQPGGGKKRRKRR